MNYMEYIYDRIIDPLNAHSGSVPLCAFATNIYRNEV